MTAAGNATTTWTIAIPVLNEQQRLPRGIAELTAFLAMHGFDGAEIVIADNGSTDATQQVGEELARTHANVRYLKVGARGVGLALKAAWGGSVADIVGYMDVDLATDIRHLLEVRAAFGDPSVDVVSGSRLVPGAQVVNRTRLRELTSRGFNRLLRLIVGARFSDGMCGFKFIRRDAWNRLGQRGWQNDGWFYCTELLVRAQWARMRTIEIAVHWQDDQNSRVRLFRLMRQYLHAMLRLRWHKREYVA